MSYKKASRIVLALLVLLAGAYFWSAIGLRDPRTRGAIGPGYFPVMLSVLLLVLCAISFVQTLRRTEDHQITIPNARLVALTLAASGLFLVAWRYLDGFYALVFLFVAGLVTLFSPRRSLRQHAINLTLALVLTLCVWGLFGHIMQVRF